MHFVSKDISSWVMPIQSRHGSAHAVQILHFRWHMVCIPDGCNSCCRPMLDEAASASYELTEAEYAANEVEDTWVQKLLGSMVAVLQWLQPLLTPSNYDALVASILEKVPSLMESSGGLAPDLLAATCLLLTSSLRAMLWCSVLMQCVIAHS